MQMFLLALQIVGAVILVVLVIVGGISLIMFGINYISEIEDRENDENHV